MSAPRFGINVNNTVIVVDFETTGLSPDWGDRITEVAAVVIEDRKIVKRYQSLMNAGVPIPQYVQELTGITNAMIRKAPPVSAVMQELARFVGAAPLVAHNASFDRRFLDAELARIRRSRVQDVVCSMRVARRIYPNAPNHKLSTLVSYAKVPASGRHHRALSDAMMTANLWLNMQDALSTGYRLRRVPLDLMQRLQNVPCRSLDGFISRYRKLYDI